MTNYPKKGWLRNQSHLSERRLMGVIAAPTNPRGLNWTYKRGVIKQQNIPGEIYSIHYSVGRDQIIDWGILEYK